MKTLSEDERRIVEQLVADHDKRVRDTEPELRAYRDAFSDKFWHGLRHRPKSTAVGPIQSTDWLMKMPVLAETNRVRVFVDSYRDGLFYKGLRATVRPPTVPKAPLKELLDRGTPDDPSPSAADQVSEALRYWISRADVEEAAEQAVDMALMYPEVGFKVTHDSDTKSDNPLDAVRLEALPPWEVVFDRRARSLRHLRSIGHIYWTSWSDLKERYPDVERSEFVLTRRIDVLDGRSDTVDVDGEEGVRILEILDLCEDTFVPTGNGEDRKVKGKFRVIALSSAKPCMVLFEGPPPYVGPDDTPLPFIIPVVLLNVPEHRLMGLSPVAGTYALNAEMNVTRTLLHTGMVKDVARKMLVDATKVDEETLTKILGGDDMEFIRVDSPGEGGLKGAVMPVEFPPLSKTLGDSMTVLAADMDATSGLSPMSRGQALKYATAAEVHSHNDYSETTLGRLRKRLDKAVVRVLRTFLRVLAAAMEDRKEKGVALHVDGKLVTLKRDWLNEQWDLDLADVATSPLAEAQARMELTQAMPMLDAAYERLKAGDPFGRALIRYIVDLYNLPSEFMPDALLREQPPAPEPEPAPTPAPPPEAVASPGSPPGAPPVNDAAVEAVIGAIADQQGL